MNEFNIQVCDERHDRIKEDMDTIFSKLDKVESRTTTMLTALCLNLVGIIVILVKGMF